MTEEIESNEILTTEEVARYLRVNPATVRKYYRMLGGIRLGRIYRFHKDAVRSAVVVTPTRIVSKDEQTTTTVLEAMDRERALIRQPRRRKKIEDPYGLRPDGKSRRRK
jgi:excisionase family DNA binding protein